MIGRGTATFDALSIAWAERAPGATGSRTVFATHYHELNNLAAERDRGQLPGAGGETGEDLLHQVQAAAPAAAMASKRHAWPAFARGATGPTGARSTGGLGARPLIRQIDETEQQKRGS